MQRNCLRHCLRTRNPSFQPVRYASAKPIVRRVVTKQVPQKSAAKSGATYAPSPIFGAFKPSAKEAVKKPISPKKPEESKKTESKTEEVEKDEPKAPLTEDEKMYIYKSLKMKTSVKKLGNLTRQIAHKDIDHAITQMRFSPKRTARMILRGLEHAKEEAIALQEMKSGQIVVDEAWVGRNAFRKQFWPRARGRLNIRMRPFTHFTVKLKSAEAVNKRVEAKKMKKMKKIGKPPAQNKPIYNPRPYYTW